MVAAQNAQVQASQPETNDGGKDNVMITSASGGQ